MAGKEKEKIIKAAPIQPFTREVGQPGFILGSTFVQDRKEKELKIPRRWDVFEEMTADACVAEALTAKQTLLFLAIYKGRWEESEYGTGRSKVLAEYLNQQFFDMPGMTWAEVCQNIISHVQNGLSIQEIVARKATSGKYRGAAELIKLAPRNVDSIYAWVWDEHIREVLQVVQNPLRTVDNVVASNQQASYLGNITNVQQVISDNISIRNYPILSMNKLLHVRYNPHKGDPIGRSPFIAAFSAYQEKKIIDQYQIIGITRDFGGLPVFRAPAELYERANDPETYPKDYESLVRFQEVLADLHAGRETFLMLTSDPHEGTSMPEFDFKLLGVEGGGKQFDISSIIQAKNSEIYSAFSASYLNMGKDGKTGSYNQSSMGFNIHTFVIEKEIINITSQLQLLGKKLINASLPKWDSVSYKDMPRFVPAEPDALSPDEFGKLVQRMGSVNKLTPAMLKRAAKLAGYPLDGIDDLDFTDKGASRAGESQGSSGTGDTQSNGGASAINMENKSLQELPKNLVADEYGDGKVALIDLDNNGQVWKIVDKN